MGVCFIAILQKEHTVPSPRHLLDNFGRSGAVRRVISYLFARLLRAAGIDARYFEARATSAAPVPHHYCSNHQKNKMFPRRWSISAALRASPGTLSNQSAFAAEFSAVGSRIGPLRWFFSTAYGEGPKHSLQFRLAGTKGTHR